MNHTTKERFEALVAYTRNPLAAGITSKELEWYASDNEILLATIIFDIDNEFMAIILSRDADLKYHCISCSMMFEKIEDARNYMLSESKRLLDEEDFAIQKNNNNKRRSLFDVICDKKSINPHFKMLCYSKEYSSAKEIIEEIMPHFKDITDNNFIKDFQTINFDSRLWELYLFSYLAEEKLVIERENDAPDFLVSKGIKKVAIEAVTVNATQGNKDIESFTPEKIAALLKNDIPLKFGSSLTSKLNKINKKGEHYWEMEHTKNRPFVLAIADFHEKGSMMWSSKALEHYLYGMRQDWYVSNDGQLIITPVEESFVKGNGAEIKGFFALENSENISAVLFSASGTISKFIRMGKVAGFGDYSVGIKYGGNCYDHSHSLKPNRFFFEVDANYKESWGTGISIFHNPNARYPLSEDIFPSVAHHYMDKNRQLNSYLPAFQFFPLNGFTFMHPVTENITQNIFESKITTFSTVTGGKIDL
jgi:hypothetical protein